MKPADVWSQITELAQRYFHDPPLTEMRMVYAVAHSHFWLDLPPLWLMVVGASSTGKSDLTIKALRAVPCFQWIGDLSPTTLLSGKDSNRDGKHSLLYNLTPIPGALNKQTHGILGMSDFSRFLGLKPWVRDELVSQFRDLADGHLEHGTGEGRPTWEGKVSFLTAVTPAVEQYWSVNRELGDRFLAVQWPDQTFSHELGHRLYERIASKSNPVYELRPLVKELIYRETKPAAMTRPQIDQLSDVAKGLAQARRPLPKKLDEDEGRKEGESRIIEKLQLFACAHAAMFGREEASEEDLDVAIRLGADSIPGKRREILAVMPQGRSVTAVDIREATKLADATVRRHIEALVHLRVLSTFKSEAGIEYYEVDALYVPLIRSLRVLKPGKVVEMPVVKPPKST